MKTDVTKIIGYILISIALLVLINVTISIANNEGINEGIHNFYEVGNLPIFYGLMAITGAILIKDKK